MGRPLQYCPAAGTQVPNQARRSHNKTNNARDRVAPDKLDVPVKFPARIFGEVQSEKAEAARHAI